MSQNIPAYWRNIANGTVSGTVAKPLLFLLAVPSFFYSGIQRIRATFYSKGIIETKRLSAPVISVGNITVGGTGKTPVTALIARMLIERGLKVAVLSRGYGGSFEGETAIVSDGLRVFLDAVQAGDEPYLLATTVPGLIVVLAADRYKAGCLAIEKFAPDVFLLDDGFQHIRLHRDLNVLLLDANRPFGNGWTLPAGLLREPQSALKRADLIIFTRSPASFIPPLQSKPYCCASHQLAGIIPLSSSASLANLFNKRIIAFAGIAEPQLFFKGLATKGLKIVHTVTYPDHAKYDLTKIKELTALINQHSADYLITTEKDGVKLSYAPPELASKILLVKLELAVANPEVLNKLLADILPTCAK